MADQFNKLFNEIKERKITDKDAIDQIKKLKYQKNMTTSDKENKIGEVVFGKQFVYDENLLKDHKIFGNQILMGVAHCSLVLQALVQMSEKCDMALSNIIFLDPIQVLPSETVKLDVVLKHQNKSILFENQYFKRSVQKMVVAASGQIIADNIMRLDETIVISDWISLAIKTISSDIFYKAATQDTYGDTLFSVRKVHVLSRGVFSEIELAPEMKEEAKDYLCHPAIFDAIHVTSTFAVDPDNPLIHHWVPFVINELQINNGVSEDIYGKLYCYAELIKSNSEIKEFNCKVYNQNGKQIINVKQLCTKRIPSREAFLGISSVNISSPNLKYTQDSTVVLHKKPNEPIGNNSVPIKEKIQEYLKKTIAEVLGISRKETGIDKNFMEMGADSRTIMAVSQKIQEEIGFVLLPTVFFEYQNIVELSSYFAEEQSAQFAAYFGVQQSTDLIFSQEQANNIIKSTLVQRQQAALKESKLRDAYSYSEDDIAIIGMDGRLASSPDLNSFWKHIVDSKDLISEIPMSHWDYQPWFDENRHADNKTYSKWGSFIEDVDKFDPLFFDISPRQATWMDPQVRILLEVVYGVLEDAGYINQIKGSKTGMYTGVCFQEYWDEIVRKRIPITSYEHVSSSMSTLSAHISYTFDLHGPSIPLDNACASSLTAMHLACQALKTGECDLAVVAGINLLLSPLHHVYFSRMQALSPTGRCHSFDKQADGYVPGEGVVAVLLKPLSKAIKDQDNIHAVIKGTAINHGGRSNNLTSPRPELQTEVILEAWKNANISPETLGYIECHGTGTALGDPIEVSSLQKAFRKHTSKTNFCAIGSAKAHIGHLEGAAGLTSVLKVILSMKHKKIPQMPNYKEMNPIIKLEDSPLYINTEVLEWKTEGSTPRRAGISSFGMIGNNAHVVIEEYVPKQKRPQIQVTHENPAIVVLSARNTDRLREQVERLLSAIRTQGFSDNDLADIAYTLQVGREGMEERLAVIAGSIKELEEKLKSFLEGQDDIPDMYRGQVKHNRETLAVFTADEDMQKAIEAWVVKGKHVKLVDLWVKGLIFDWNKLYGETKPCRISLPTYPFARERYWMPDIESTPAVHKNTSHLFKKRSASTLTGRKLDHAASKSNPVQEAQEAFELMTFEETWQEQVLPDNSSARIKAMVCFLSDSKKQQAAIEAVQALDGQTRVIFISQSTSYRKQSEQAYHISPKDPDTYKDAFKSIREDYGNIDAVLYLWPLEDKKHIRDYSCIVHILQGISFSKLKPSHILLAAQYEDMLERCHLESWIGFERSLGLVMPDTRIAAIMQESEENREPDIKDWLQKLWREMPTPKNSSILYQEGKRYICRIRPTKMQPGNSLLKPGGTYLITGGCGGLGLQLAGHLAKTQHANLILTGRSPMDEKKQMKIKILEDLGGQVLYLQADVCDQARMKEGLSQAKERFGEIRGVVHAAGLAGGGSILDKDISSFEEVLGPKIKGTIILDELLCREPLDFICYFSSSAAILGDFGSCDYAVGNRFLMAYGHYRNNQQPGKAVVINWPLWKEGGMGAKEGDNAEMYLKSSGQRFLETEEGIFMFDRLLAQNNIQHLVLAGQPGRVHSFLGLAGNQSQAQTPDIYKPSGKGRRTEMKGLSLEQCLEWDLKELAGNVLKIPREKLDKEENFADFGFDSISLARFATILTGHYGIEITPAVFFGYSTIERLTQYFFTEHQQAIQNFYREDAAKQAVLQKAPQAASSEQGAGSFMLAVDSTPQSIPEPIAVIGMSGRFPGADTVGELWNNLKDGRECITEIPASRWDWQKYYGDPHQEDGKTNSRWGGFISNPDQFDPLFFEISPKEAEVMDPQQRIFLEEAWHALEDAGYMGEKIRGTSCGVYVGVEESQYGMVTGGKGQLNSNQNATLSARIAYLLDLKGPNLALTAACASGLVAIHHACQALRQGDCNMALVGGIGLLVTPMIYLALSQADMLSSDGKCYVFEQRADGLVPGEAAAVVLLKPLSKAISDKDHIYGCIKASGVNYNGRGNGITAPNLVSQTELIKNIYNKYDINPSNIQYVLSHSVGSKFGDSIEVEALTNSFKQYTNKKQFCTLGSVKPLIGHTFAASGVVNLISMLMAMKYHTIPALPNHEAKNEYINFIESPFIISKENQAWITENGQKKLGAISSTGISGTNAHAVIEEYLPPQEEPICPLKDLPQIIVFSAKNPDRLRVIIQQMLDFLNSESSAGIRLPDIAYTLQTGRDAMKERVAIVASSKQDLCSKLEAIISSRHAEMFPKEIITGNIEKIKEDSKKQLSDREGIEIIIKNALEGRNLNQFALLWVEGFNIPWEKLHQDEAVKRISLPAYPFAKRRCWIDINQNNNPEEKCAATLEQEYKNKAVELYTIITRDSKKEFQEEYLTFCPFEEKIPGFSMSRVFLHPEQFAAEAELVKAKQIEMRQVLFCKEDFNQIKKLLDIGCGHATDIIQIAALYPNIKTHGFTITKAQAELGNQRIAEMKLGSRAQVFNRDSSKAPFPDCYDLIIGIEVCCHIRDKHSLFKNISASLDEDGRVLLMDFIANLRGSIVDPNIEISIATSKDWIDIFSTYNLVIDEIIDVSRQIANYTYDLELEQNIKHLPEVSQNSLRNYANQSLSIEQGWLSYCLFKLKKDTKRSKSELLEDNAYKLAHKTPYSKALTEMLDQGYIPYPKSLDKTFSNQQNDSKNHQLIDNKIHTGILKDLTIISEILREEFLTVLGLERTDLEEAETFQGLGVGSINAVKLLEAINTRFNLDLPTSVIFEFNTLDSLAKYIAEYVPELTEQIMSVNQAAGQLQEVLSEEKHTKVNVVSNLDTQLQKSTDDIAVVGLSCRCAGANGQNEFWDLLRQGKDCIQEIKKQSWLDFFDANSLNMVPSRYGAIEDIEFFDSLFFKISPKEAESMDVAQRILLQECYKALEDAGYTPSSLQGRQVGTIIGTMGNVSVTQDFSHFSMLGYDTSILAARIAYFLDLKGPAMAINTACSSSLVAVDTACNKLKNHEIDLAISGGITIYSNPGAFITMNNAGMLSPTGECRPFDNEANGIVVGDGVGVVILKRLKEAQRDNDFIYGIIRGSGTNQDGQTSGITAPSFLSQSQLQESVYRRNHIAVEDIQYIEAHGTATKLGDPIEIDALSDSFKKFTARKCFCAIGSMKANIGHTTAAAGVLSLIKVLLSMKNKEMAPSINFTKGNEHIDFENSPVVVNTTLKEWPVNSKGSRLAAINSFGFSGTNAHIVVEEYPANSQGSVKVEGATPGLLVLSAESEEVLREYARETKEFIQACNDFNLADLLYTFQVGRASMSYRLALLSNNKEMLLAKLEQFIEGNVPIDSFFGKTGKNNVINLGDTEEGKEYIQRLIKNNNTRKLAELWVNGNQIDWKVIYQKGAVRRLPGLPTYPFAKKRYRIPEIEVKPVSSTAAIAPAIHPLLHQNTSTLAEQRFTSVFTGQELFLADHKINGQNILPGVAYLEMARVAIEKAVGASDEALIRLEDVVWVRPITVEGQPIQVHIALYPEETGRIAYEIYSQPDQNNTKPIVHSQGAAVLGIAKEPPVLVLKTLQTQCTQTILSASQCYGAFKSAGFDYGPTLKGIERVYVGSGQVLARLSLPTAISDTQCQFVLHPGMMDSALQASIGLMMSMVSSGGGIGSKLSPPFALNELQIFGGCTSAMWAHIRYNDDNVSGDRVLKLDIDLCDEQGRVCVRMKAVSLIMLEGDIQIGNPEKAVSYETSIKPLVGTFMMKPVWDVDLIEKGQALPYPTDRVVIAGDDKGDRSVIMQYYPNAQVLHIQSDDTIEAIVKRIKEQDSIDHILYIVPYRPLKSQADEALIEEQEKGVLQIFRMIKALLRLDYGDKVLGWTIITVQTQPINKNDVVNPTHASLHGLVGSMAKEYPNWQVRLVDLEADCTWPMEDIFTLLPNPQGNPWIYRGQEWHRQKLIPFQSPPFEWTLYKPEGVYVVIGGAGGIGEAWSEYMISTYHARIIWIGRRQKDETIQAQIDRLAALGPEPQYISADAANRNALQKAYEQVKQLYGQINGVIHSAIGLLDQSLANMEEERFRGGLLAKVDVSVRLAQVFKQEPLDFALFFSSIGAFAKDHGRSNYSAGCSFEDAFANYLSREWPCAVKVMNWGYWGNVGVGSVIPQVFKNSIAMAGLSSIEPSEAMDALERLLTGPIDQIALVKTTKPLVMERINPQEQIVIYPENIHSYIHKIKNRILKQGLQDKNMKLEIGVHMQEIDSLLCKLLFGQLQSIGLFTEKNFMIDDLETKGLNHLLKRWLAESIVVLTSNNYLSFDKEVYTVADPTPIGIEAVWNEWHLKKHPWLNEPNTRDKIILVEATLRALPDILTGKVPATDVMFPNSSMELVEGIYKNNPISDYFNGNLADTLVAYIEKRRQDQSGRLRIIEIGAGTGGTSEMVFEKIKPFRDYIEEYCYTDVSKAFLLHAEKEYGSDNPYLTFQIFDVEAPIAKQNISAGGYDVVIAANVLHATKNIRQTLRNIKAILKKNGLLLLNEISGNTLFTHLTFGLLDGWWLYEDTALRIPGCPGLSSQTWQSVLEDEGFQQVFFTAQEGHVYGQQNIAAESDGVVRQKLLEPDTEKKKDGMTLKKPQKFPVRKVGGPTQDLIREKSTAYFKKIIGDILKIPCNEIDSSEQLESYGIDSILIVQLSNTLRKVFENISSTLFFEYQTIDAIVDYFMKTQRSSLISLTGLEDNNPTEGQGSDEEIFIPPNPLHQNYTFRVSEHPFVLHKRPIENPESQQYREPIAIIGLSGRYPQAKDIQEYWENLKAGKDCITEIPEERWPLEGFYYPNSKGAIPQGKSYSKWGGFIEGFADFDPLFFNISPREAINMDPQERLFIESCWGVLEDAGYTKEQLATKHNQRVGVFAGITRTGFDLYGPDLWKQDEKFSPYTSFCSAANRVSYLLNLQGPSIPIDTMCSSSLVAIHEACEHIHNGECEMAIAGGVNLYLHPSSYIGLCAQNMLSADGKCKSFGRGGNGFVPGEGVGCILLKRLSQAVADEDHIYAIIRGTRINHGGKTNGYTVPNPTAQGEVIRTAMDKAGVDARTISYVEAHGTGTELGDPIEISGLTQAFRKDTHDTGFCAIGSVKTNIGHLEGAAGIAGVTKILLQMKHQKIAPSLHSSELNPNIDFAGTPFIVQQELAEWKRPHIKIDGETSEYPRIAGISAFGAGGSNAHAVIEEYIPKLKRPQIQVTRGNPAIVVLSARNADRLHEQVERLLNAIQVQRLSDTDLADIAYTLQVGREGMEERLAVIVVSIKELEEKLKSFLEGRNEIPDLYRGQVKRNKDTLAFFTADEDMQKAIEAWAVKGKHTKLVNLWVKGLSFDWNKLYGDIKPCRISLPTYPFDRERYWVPESKKQIETTSLPLQSSIQFDEKFYDLLIDEIMKDTISIDTAIQKAEDFISMQNGFPVLGGEL
ncbi:Mycocerosate synthase., 6-deoxyerythronolide-B synthase [Ruminiclostridium papyrosolvens DSM 2782]|uniref:Mycocerosate synthase., 6-deoxyerythronolide-B synthase n=1 Tax=Ruminiclostridium papyrosolvens DSM 2782 TaxID=588581 RepID=F1TIW0_9FIRM|nr:SDR family NAD(P)-dependent oxidoreductase [Ruminiclostridium papyrosolvens]EGD45657.1 Mycocerosate synthase., 6-deoxyerythronolide-B synthase [Ruminiclostridium papyrosolvens DSM 2782]